MRSPLVSNYNDDEEPTDGNDGNNLHTPWFFLILAIEHWRAIEGDGPGLEGDVEQPRAGFEKPDHVSFAANFLQIFYMPPILPFSFLTLCLFI